MSYAIAQEKIAQAKAEGSTELDLPELRSCFRVIGSGQLTGHQWDGVAQIQAKS